MAEQNRIYVYVDEVDTCYVWRILIDGNYKNTYRDIYLRETFVIAKTILICFRERIDLIYITLFMKGCTYVSRRGLRSSQIRYLLYTAKFSNFF